MSTKQTMEYSNENPNEFIEHIMELLKTKRIASTFIGFSENEVQKVKDNQGISVLPKLFESYLTHMGHQGFTQIFVGSDFGLFAMEGDKETMILNIEHRNTIYPKTITLPNDIFVFMSHQGHSYMFFESTDIDDDPPVYIYTESGFEVRKVSDRLSEFFINEINNFELRRNAALGRVRKKPNNNDNDKTG